MSVLLAIAAIDNPLNCLIVSTTHRPMEFSISPLAQVVEFSAAPMVILAFFYTVQCGWMKCFMVAKVVKVLLSSRN